jgi:biotin transporter BioY
MVSSTKDLKPEYGLGNTLMMIVMAGAVWVGLSFLIGALHLSGGGLISVVEGSGAYTPAFGTAYIASGVLATLCIFRIYRQQKYQQAFLSCLFGSLIMLVFGFCLVIYYLTVKNVSADQAFIAPIIEIGAGAAGLILTVLLTRERGRFQS